MAENIFTHWVFTDYLLPWILIFVLIFAILEKTKLFGEGKRQINAIIGAICGLILLSFENSREIIINLIPFLVVAMVVIFIFMLLYAFVSGEEKGDLFSKNVKIWIGVGIAIALLIAVLVATKTFDGIWDYLSSSNAGANILFIILAAAAVVAVLVSSKKEDKD